MDAEQFRKAGYAAVDRIVEYLERDVAAMPVLSQVAPGWVRSQMPAPSPQGGDDFADVLGDLDRVVLPGLTNWQSPNFFAYFPANASYPSILGELLAAGLGVQGMSWATSPACTEVEQHVLDWMVELLGLPERFRGNGVIQGSASEATLCAVLAARERVGGAGGPLERLVAYASEQAHSSVEKGLRIAGIPASRLRLVPTDDRFALRADVLAAQVEADRAAGLVPFLVVATAGTTSSMAFDPVAGLAEACERHDLWLHVDGAMAGIAALCPELRWVNDGLEHADSYVTNAHKWMGVNFDCSLFWVADRGPLLDALSIQPPYLRTAAKEAGAVVDFRDWQVPLGRRFRSLKLWFVLRCDGPEPLRAMIRRHVGLAAHLAERAGADPRFVLAAPPALDLVCVRLAAGDDATRALVDAVNHSGRALVTPTVLDGRAVMRLCVGARTTERHHVEALWELISSLAGDSTA